MAILQQGQKYMGGVVQYDTATGKPLAQGQTTVETKDLTTPTSSAITPSALTPAKPLQPATPQPYTPPIAPTLTAPQIDVNQRGQQEMALIDPLRSLIDSLSSGTSELAQKSFRSQQAESTGLNAAQNLAQSLYDKSTSLDLRAQAIQAQKQADIQGLQNTAQQGGFNVTKGGLAPQQRAIETRANQQSLENTLAKLDNAVSYYAATGKVREAQQAVDQAVDAEFTPKLLALDTKQRDLDSLLKSPYLTQAQQEIALNRQAQLDFQKQQIQDAAQLKKDTGDARIKVLTNNPNMTQLQHDAIAAAQSPEEVAQLVNYFGLSSLSQQEKFAQDMQKQKFAQDEKQFGMQYALQKQKFEEDKRQFDVQMKVKAVEDATKALKEAKTSQQKAQAAQAQKEAQLPVIENKINLVDQLLSNTNGITSMVGTKFYQRLTNPYTGLVSSEQQDLVAGVNQLLNQSTLDALLALKAQGGTLGALSEKEGAMLREAASKIGSWEHKDKDGNVKYYDTSEKSFIAELNAIKASAERLKAGIVASQGTTLPPEDTAQIDQLFGDTQQPQEFNPANFY